MGKSRETHQAQNVHQGSFGMGGHAAGCVAAGWQLSRVGRALVFPGWLGTAQSASTASPHSGQRNGLRLALDRKKA